MIAQYYLVALVTFGQGSAMTSTPMQDLETCKAAAVEAEKLKGPFSTIRTACLRAKP